MVAVGVGAAGSLDCATRETFHEAWSSGFCLLSPRAPKYALAGRACFCRIVERRLGADHGIEDEKVQRKFDRQLAAGEREAEAAGRAVHPLHRVTQAHRLAKLSAQFIRTLRNHLFSHKPVLALLGAFSAALRSYM